MSSSLSLVRSIAISYGLFIRPSPEEYVQPSHELALKIIGKLWNQWGRDRSGVRNGEVDLYNVNIPLVPELLREGGMEVVWTRIWRNTYGSVSSGSRELSFFFKFEKLPYTIQLFQPQNSDSSTTPAGPDAKISRDSPPSSAQQEQHPQQIVSAPALAFKFAPQITSLVNPAINSLPYGSDAWAVHHAKASVTPLRTSFAEPGNDGMVLVGESSDVTNLGGEAGRAFKL